MRRRDWHTRLHESPLRRGRGRLRITVVDLEADWKCRALSLRYPQLAGVCDLVPLTMDVRWPEFYAGAFLAGTTRRGSGTARLSARSSSASTTTRWGCAPAWPSTSACCMRPPARRRWWCAWPRPAGWRGWWTRTAMDDQRATFANLHAFGLLDHTCTPEAILGGTHEVLARGLHEVYVQQQEALGHTSATNPSLVEWDKLPEALRESNRAEADGIFHHLAALGYTLTPLADWDAAFFRFPEPEVERLAEMEHDRFVAERCSQAGATPAVPKISTPSAARAAPVGRAA